MQPVARSARRVASSATVAFELARRSHAGALAITRERAALLADALTRHSNDSILSPRSFGVDAASAAEAARRLLLIREATSKGLIGPVHHDAEDDAAVSALFAGRSSWPDVSEEFTEPDSVLERAARILTTSRVSVRGGPAASLVKPRVALVPQARMKAPLDKYVRDLHTTAAPSDAPDDSGTASSGGRPVYLKVGDGRWTRFERDVSSLDRTGLLQALKAGTLFGGRFKGVDLTACTVAVVKNEKIGDAKVPRAGQDEGDNVVELTLAKTVGSVAAAAGSDKPGAPLFIRVRVPPPPSAPAASWLSDFFVAGPRDRVAAAVAAIVGGRVTTLPGGHLHMEGAIWPSATNSELFVRECYEPLAQRERRFVIAGQPGIGKSVLIWVIAYRLLTEQPGRAIVYFDNTNTCYVIVPGEPVYICPPVAVPKLPHSPELAALNPVFLCDSIIPPTPPFPCVVVSSPGRLARLASEELQQQYMPWLYVPVPTEEEVLRMREVAFQHEPEAIVRQRMALWGPNPRYVLVRTSKHEQDEAWGLARSATLQDVLKAAKAESFGAPIGDKGDAPHRLVMERCVGQDAPVGSPESDMRNRAFWERGAVVIASSPMARYVVDRMAEEKRWAAFLANATAKSLEDEVARVSLADVPTPEQCLAQLNAAQTASTRQSQS